jgi:citrate lyase subunit beta/citryl-CoA lyase
VVEAAGSFLDLVVVPKVQRPSDVVTVDTLLTGIETNTGLQSSRIRITAQIETAEGLVRVDHIARASSRLHSLDFGPGDYAADTGMPAEAIGVAGRWDAMYPGDRYHYAMARLVAAAAAADISPIDGPSADFRDLDAFREACLRARALGYQGKWCIHPAQVPIVNEVFAPTEEEVDRARALIEAYERAQATGTGAMTHEGVMIDAASVRMARRVLQQEGLPARSQ